MVLVLLFGEGDGTHSSAPAWKIRAADEGQGPIFRSHTPYAKFLRLLATFHMHPIFPETAEDRSVLAYAPLLRGKPIGPQLSAESFRVLIGLQI